MQKPFVNVVAVGGPRGVAVVVRKPAMPKKPQNVPARHAAELAPPGRIESPRCGSRNAVMTRAIALIGLMLFTLSSRAEDERVRIPHACRELANRAGLPLTLTRPEAARAAAYLRLMSSRDPAVRRCLQAVSRN
jgi:hypothetical protein